MAEDLPVDVLEIIFGSLTTNLSDLYACSAACSQWHRAAKPIISSVPKPLLYISPISKLESQHNHDKLVTYYCSKNTSTTKPMYDITLPGFLTASKNAHPTHKGWFLHAGNHGNAVLYNPLSREIKTLPQISTTDAYEYKDVQFVTSTDPTEPNCRILVHNFDSKDGYNVRFDFCRVGGDKWTSIYVDCAKYQIHDMIYHNRCFYAVSRKGELLEFDLDGQHMTRSKVAKKKSNTWPAIYLAESPSKELISVWKEKNHVMVFKMNWDKRRWERMTKLGDRESIFLACSDSFFVKTDHYQSNCVYFFDESWGGNGGSNDFGFYDMNSESIEEVVMTSSAYHASFYRWFL